MILLRLALYLPSTSVIFGFRGALYIVKKFIVTSFSLPLSELSFVGLIFDLVD